MMKGGGGVIIVVPVVLVILIAASLLVYLPLNPSLTVTFKVSASPGYAISVNTNSTATFYSKGTIFGTAGIPQGPIFLSRLGALNGSYVLAIRVGYGPTILSN